MTKNTFNTPYRCRLRYLVKGVRAYWGHTAKNANAQATAKLPVLLLSVILIAALMPLLGSSVPLLASAMRAVPDGTFWVLGVLALAATVAVPFWYLLRFFRWLRFCCRLGWELEQRELRTKAVSELQKIQS